MEFPIINFLLIKAIFRCWVCDSFTQKAVTLDTREIFIKKAVVTNKKQKNAYWSQKYKFLTSFFELE